MTRLALYAIPPKVDREKLALLRRQLIHKHGGGRAVQYPIHCTLVRGVEVRDPDALLADLRARLPSLRPVELQAGVSLVTGAYWAGVGLRSNAPFERLRAALLATVERHAAELVPAPSPPHISLAYGARITGVSRILSPIKRLGIRSVSVAVEDRTGAFRVVEELLLKT